MEYAKIKSKEFKLKFSQSEFSTGKFYCEYALIDRDLFPIPPEERIVHLRSIVLLFPNSDFPPLERFAILFHEFGHFFFGHFLIAHHEGDFLFREIMASAYSLRCFKKKYHEKILKRHHKGYCTYEDIPFKVFKEKIFMMDNLIEKIIKGQL